MSWVTCEKCGDRVHAATVGDHECAAEALGQTIRAARVFKLLACALGCGDTNASSRPGVTVLAFVCGACHIKLCGPSCSGECVARDLLS